MNHYHEPSLIGLDVKRRKKRRPRRNRYHQPLRWLLPTTIAIITLAVFALAGIR